MSPLATTAAACCPRCRTGRDPRRPGGRHPRDQGRDPGPHRGLGPDGRGGVRGHRAPRPGRGRRDRRRAGERGETVWPVDRLRRHRGRARCPPQTGRCCTGAAASSSAVTSTASRRSAGTATSSTTSRATGSSRTTAGPGDDFFGSVGSKPEIYPVYWSPAQMQARQSERMATVQAFLNRQWKNESDGVQWFDPDRDSLYPDRIRRRPEGADSGGLGTHLDPGTLDLWMTQAYQQAFRHLFDGTVEAYDPWDAAHRTAGPQYPGTHDVLGVPHLPGLDGPVRHGPRPGRPAHRPDPRGHGLPHAPPAAGRRARGRHVRRHRQPGRSPPARSGTRCSCRPWPASPTSRPATPSGGTAT